MHLFPGNFIFFTYDLIQKIINYLFEYFRSLILDSPSTESHVSNSVTSSEIEGKNYI